MCINESKNNSDEVFNRIVDSSAFLKSFFKDTKPTVDAMSIEQRTRLLNNIMGAGMA
jgi:hypothetical protein